MNHETEGNDTSLGTLEKVSDGIYGYIQPDGTWWINNTGLIRGKTASIGIDSCATERRTLAYQAAIRGIGAPLPQTLVNTHHHGDHTHGNYLFTGATIVGHENTRSEILRSGPPGPQKFWNEFDCGPIKLAPPTLTYRDGITLWVDELECHVMHVGTPAHTTNDSIVWIPSRSIVFVGDLLFNGGTPFNVMGSISGSLHVLRDLLEPLGAQTIIPGHGPIGDSALIGRVAGYLEWIQELASLGRCAGASPLELAKEADLGEYAKWTDAERLVGNLHRAYAELDGAKPGERIDVRAALTDMVAYNGGKPLTCSA